MDILLWLAIFGIAYMLMVIITFGCVISDMSVDGADGPLFFVFIIFAVGIATTLAIFWPAYWYEEYKDRKGKRDENK